MKRIRVVGCGSPEAGDDQLGLLAARRLRQQLPPEVDVVEDTTGGVHVDRWCEGVDLLLVVDAAAAAPPHPAGTHLRFAYPQDRGRLERTRIRGTHLLSLEEGLRLAETLGLLPPEVRIHALTAEHFEPASALSDGLRGPMERLVETIREEVLARLQESG